RQRRDGRLRAQALPAPRRRGAGHARAVIQLVRRPGDDASGRSAPDRARPIAAELGVHGGSGCFGPGFRANATIGRAIWLILMNVGGAWPGRYDMATQGSPAKFSYCVAECADTTPWGALHEGNAVTVFGGEPPHNVNDHVSTTAAGILTTVPDAVVPNCTFSRAVSRPIRAI